MGLKTFECPATLQQLLQQAALEQPTHGQIFLEDGLDGPETTLSYPALLEKATVRELLLKMRMEYKVWKKLMQTIGQCCETQRCRDYQPGKGSRRLL